MISVGPSVNYSVYTMAKLFLFVLVFLAQSQNPKKLSREDSSASLRAGALGSGAAVSHLLQRCTLGIDRVAEGINR